MEDLKLRGGEEEEDRKMEMIKKTDEKILFKAKMDESLANAIRRSVSLVPVMAIDEVEISRNDSAMYDETLAHRLGLVPLKFDKSFKEDNVLKFKIDSKKEGAVYSGDIKGDVEVAYDRIPITLLNANQELKLKGKTKMGTAKEHAKFSPGILFYRNVSEIILDKSFERDVLRIFPKTKIKEKGNKIAFKDEQEKGILDFCEGISQKNKKPIEVNETGELVFVVESFGQMKADEIFKKAAEALKKELKNVTKTIK